MGGTGQTPPHPMDALKLVPTPICPHSWCPGYFVIHDDVRSLIAPACRHPVMSHAWTVS